METEKDLKASLANIPFESLLKANKTTGMDLHSKRIKKVDKNLINNNLPRTDKNAPKEQNSKQYVNPYKVVMKPSRKVTRDPRFDDLSGTFNKSKFYQTYNFVEQMKYKENKIIRTNLKQAKRKKHSKKFTEEEKEEMVDHFADNKQGLGRLLQIKKEDEVKMNLKKELQEKTGIKHKFISKFAIKAKLAEIREAKKVKKASAKF